MIERFEDKDMYNWIKIFDNKNPEHQIIIMPHLKGSVISIPLDNLYFSFAAQENALASVQKEPNTAGLAWGRAIRLSINGKL